MPLSKAPIVKAELDQIIARIGALPQKGPVIVSEHNHLPYTGSEFRRQWHKIADAADIPKNVFNMDSGDG